MAKNELRIKLLGDAINAHGEFKAGDEITLPEQDARPLLDSGAAERAEDEPAKSAKKGK